MKKGVLQNREATSLPAVSQRDPVAANEALALVPYGQNGGDNITVHTANIEAFGINSNPSSKTSRQIFQPYVSIMLGRPTGISGSEATQIV
jgi:hypothetical protein